MEMMSVRDLALSLNNVNPSDVEDGYSSCIRAGLQKDFKTKAIIGYTYYCKAGNYKTYAIKVPANDENKVTFEDIQNRLRTKESVLLIPHNIDINAYAFLPEPENLREGVSLKADSVKVADSMTSKKAIEDDDEIIDF